VRSRSVIYHEILAGLERKLLRDDACGRVRAARAEADHDAHRPARVALAPARTRHNTEDRSQKYQGRRFSLHHTGNITERLLKKTNESRRETQMAISHENKSAARQGRSDLRLSACIFGSLLSFCSRSADDLSPLAGFGAYELGELLGSHRPRFDPHCAHA